MLFNQATKSALLAACLLAPTLIQAISSCRRTGAVFFNTFTLDIDNGNCNERAAYETILKGTAIGCVGLTGSGCNQNGALATITFNEAITCPDSAVQSAAKTQFGVDTDCQ